MSAADWALVALVPSLLLYLGYQWGKATSAKELEDAQWAVTNAEAEAALATQAARDLIAAKHVAEAALRALQREAGATPIFDRLAERREGFERTADEIRGLPEVGA